MRRREENMSEKDVKRKQAEQEGQRINLRLSRAGVCSRREADALIRAGRVTVDGEPASMGQKVMPGQQICLDGAPVGEERKAVILAVHKPRGVVCTTDRRWGDVLLEDLVDCSERVFYAGRLDKESEGLILMTNQGELSNRMMRAASGHEKEYVVTIDREVDERLLAQLAKGVYLPELGVTTRPCRVFRSGKCTFHIILTQGLNRQIRRMCKECGCSVERLVRIRVMNICLKDLPVGKWRPLTGQERAELERLIRAGEANDPGRRARDKSDRTGNRRIT